MNQKSYSLCANELFEGECPYGDSNPSYKNNENRVLWAVLDSNQRPLRCQRNALTS